MFHVCKWWIVVIWPAWPWQVASKRPRRRRPAKAGRRGCGYGRERAGGRRSRRPSAPASRPPTRRSRSPAPPPTIPKVALSDALARHLPGQRRRHDARRRTPRSCRQAAGVEQSVRPETDGVCFWTSGTHRARVAATENLKDWMSEVAAAVRRQGRAGGWDPRGRGGGTRQAARGRSGATFPVLLDAESRLFAKIATDEADAADLPLDATGQNPVVRRGVFSLRPRKSWCKASVPRWRAMIEWEPGGLA